MPESKVGAEAFQFRTAESFLNSLNNKAKEKQVDISKYKEGQRIYHKKFGEGTIDKIEEEGEDYKLDINFDKVGHKRLMAKFAELNNRIRKLKMNNKMCTKNIIYYSFFN